MNTGISEIVNNWFHDDDEMGTSPACAIQYVSHKFLEHAETNNLNLVCVEKIFRSCMCEAMCALYHANLTNRRLKGPTRKMLKPKNWNDDAEICWIDYLHSRVFSTEFWEHVWADLKFEDWENKVPTWRTTIQLLMPEYVKRDVSALVDAGLMFEDSSGELVDAAEYDQTLEEFDDRNY